MVSIARYFFIEILGVYKKRRDQTLFWGAALLPQLRYLQDAQSDTYNGVI
jgi:hypothetical protein